VVRPPFFQESTMPRKLLLCLAAAAALSACKAKTRRHRAGHRYRRREAGRPSFSPEINAGDFAEMVKTLASDEFEGRAPAARARN
jgi:uncharacterized lipoprotein